MAAPDPKQLWEQFFRVQFESSFGAGGGSADWNIGGNGGGATGWRDIPVTPGSVRINPIETAIFAQYAAGKRPINQQAPVAGGVDVSGSFEMPVYPEFVYPFFRAVMGGVSNAETAGAAAKSSVAFASLATLDTQPNGTEVLKFVISSSTAASGASINIIQSATTQETITIGTSASSVDGTYYSKGAYDGSTNAITFTVAGSVTSGNVVVSGVDKVTNTLTLASTVPTMKIEEAGQPKSASNSMFYTGAAFMDLVLNWDVTALDGLLMATTNFNSQFPAAATKGTYDNDPKNYSFPFAAWHCSLTKDGSAFDKLRSASLTINGGNELFKIASGAQNPDGVSFGGQEVFGTLTVLPEDASEWNDFVGQTVADYHIVFTSPNNIVDSNKYTITIELSEAYIETYNENAQNQMFGADMAIRTTDDASDSAVKVTLVTRQPL
jgi:hypothetical protein